MIDDGTGGLKHWEVIPQGNVLEQQDHHTCCIGVVGVGITLVAQARTFSTRM